MLKYTVVIIRRYVEVYSRDTMRYVEVYSGDNKEVCLSIQWRPYGGIMKYTVETIRRYNEVYSGEHKEVYSSIPWRHNAVC